SRRHAAPPWSPLLDPERLLHGEARGFQLHAVGPRQQMRAVVEEEIHHEVEAPGIAVALRRRGDVGKGQDVDAAGPELATVHRLNHEQDERPRVAVVVEVAQVVGQLRHDRAVAQPDLDLNEGIAVLVLVVGVKSHARAREERIWRGWNRRLGHGAPRYAFGLRYAFSRTRSQHRMMAPGTETTSAALAGPADQSM